MHYLMEENMIWIISIIAWVIFLVVCINIGKEKNRNGFLWGLFFGPLGLLILAILPKIEMPSPNVGTSTSYSSPVKSASDSGFTPTFMRREMEKNTTVDNSALVKDLPKISATIEEKNIYYDNDPSSKKWICGKCGETNKINSNECKKCKNIKGLLKTN